MDVGGGAGFHLPEGFRFNPTDQDLILYYLQPKVLGQELPCNIIREDINVYGAEPWAFIPSSIHEAYFFFFRPHRCRTVSSSGRWKINSGKKTIKADGKIIGYMNTLVFEVLKKRENTGWIMHEYELPPPINRANTNGGVWVICRIKRNKQLEKKRTRCHDEDGVSIENEEFSLLSSQDDSKKMACHARGWEQESLKDVRLDFPRDHVQEEALKQIEMELDVRFDFPRDHVQEDSLKQLEMELNAIMDGVLPSGGTT